MKKAPTYEFERERLQTLLDYKVLDTSPSAEYDDITHLASSICGTPIALISLIDENRQWFKSRHGLGATETPRDISFCGHAICERNVFIVNDAFEDKRFADNPLVLGAPHVRFYAAAQLIAPNGYAIGTVCVIDHKPRNLEADQARALQVLAKQVVTQLELFKTNSMLKDKLIDIQTSVKTIEELRADLVHASQLSLLGEMAAGIGHEINNPLSIITGNVNLLQQILSSGEPLVASDMMVRLNKIAGASYRASGIIKSLRNLSRDAGQDPIAVVNLGQTLNEAVALCKEKISTRGIDIIVSQVGEHNVMGRVPHILQILSNLISNAADAVQSLSDRWIKINVTVNAEFAKVIVTDSGAGIQPETQKKLMQPFFTTKDPGKGTGLGLSISKKLAESQGGKLYLDNSSKNTTFILELPLAASLAKQA